MREHAERSRIYVVDDDGSVRDSLHALLTAHGFDTVSFACGEDFLEALDPTAALCAFLDLRMPGHSGIQLQAILAARGISVPVVILTAHGDVPLAVEAMKAGVMDFIEKPASESRLLRAIATAQSRLANNLHPKMPDDIISERVAKLTIREKHVLDHLILGMTNKHVADELGISQRTVEIHRSRIREKMEARGLADLIRMMR